MKKSPRGFTIVELLVVVVVIGVLASIMTVAYSGVYSKTKNTKTVSAATAWIKAIKMYKDDKGSWPDISCLGNTSTYIDEGGQCWTNVTVTSNFLSQMQPYIGTGYPEPDTTNLLDSGDPTGPKRGAFFWPSLTPPQVYVLVANSTICPNILGLPRYGQTFGNGIRCRYLLE